MKGAGGFTLRTTIAGVVGGTASEIGGGKFANGAVTGAFVMMYNEMGHENTLTQAQFEKEYERFQANDSGLIDVSGLFSGIVLAPFRLVGTLGESLFGSELFGVGSKLFGQKYVRQGILNKQGSFIKIGWSGSKKYGGSYLRVGIGRSSLNSNHALIHFKVPGTVVPDNIANAIREGLK